MKSKHLKEQSRSLRKEKGLSYREISEILNISVTTIARWVGDIKLSTEQEIALALRVPSFRNTRNSADLQSVKYRSIRNEFQERGKALAEKEYGDLSKRDLYLFGCALYWGEGSKSKNEISLTNSDASMLRVFKRFLVDCLELPECKLRLLIQCYCDVFSLEEIEAYWLKNLDLPKNCLYKTTIKKQGSRRGKSPYGTCRITVCCTEELQKIYGFLQQIGEFKNKQWLG